ncbi:GNAT family N-acetyltransferase [Paenibacillus daejeonensis]|uniref:GNAT family N-acetyltransferase n=1 Tax=Paenibacillus daejeonensis TaxID=135193 RepID=UPI000475B6A9|nr:GNAT family N-acetyltransferase [Paenibacillus daejeonensis]
MELTIRSLNPELLYKWKESFQSLQFHRPDDYYTQCLHENQTEARVTLLAFIGQDLAGVAHLKFESDYPYFKEHDIPEINDLNVFPAFRQRGIANQIMAEFEAIAARKHTQIGIGVGLFKSYAAAQRIYCRRGYIPDGRGLMYNNEEVKAGDHVRVDDDLCLYFTKEL